MRTFFLLLLIGFCGFVLRIAEINDVLIHDEAYTYIAFASKNLIHAVTDYSLPNNHIFHTVLVYFSTQIFGPHVWIVRLPALLAGMAIIFASYYLGKIFYSPQAGIATAALVAFFPSLVHYSTIARGYSLMGLLTILSVLFGYYALQTKRKIFWGLLSLSMALGFWTIPIMLFPAGAIYLWLLLEGLLIHRKEAYRAIWNFGLHLFASGLLTVFLTALLYYPVIHVSGLRSLVGNSFVLPMEEALWWEKFLHQVRQAWQVWAESIPDPLLYLLIFGFALSLVFHRQISKIRMLTQIVFFGWILFLAWYQRAGAFERFWTFLLPFLFLWSVAPWTELSKKLKWKNLPFSWAVSLLAVIFLIFTTASIVPGIPARWRQSSNVEQVGIYLAERMKPGEIALSGANAPPLWFYMQENGLDSSYWRLQSGFSGLYVVVSENYDGESVESVLKANRLEHISPDELVYQHRYGGILIYYFSRQP